MVLSAGFAAKASAESAHPTTAPRRKLRRLQRFREIPYADEQPPRRTHPASAFRFSMRCLAVRRPRLPRPLTRKAPKTALLRRRERARPMLQRDPVKFLCGESAALERANRHGFGRRLGVLSARDRTRGGPSGFFGSRARHGQRFEHELSPRRSVCKAARPAARSRRDARSRGRNHTAWRIPSPHPSR